MSEWWLVALASLAAYRVTRLVTLDKIAEPVAERIRWFFEHRWEAKHPEAVPNHDWNSKLAFLLSCPWCLGFWVSGVVTVILSVAYGLDYPVITWLAMSTIVGFLGRIDSE